MRSAIFTILIAALFAVAIPVAADARITPKAQTAASINLRQIEAKSLRKAKKACMDQRRYILPEIPVVTCESWNVEECGFFIPRRDRAWCSTNFLTDDKFAGSFLWTGVTWKKSKTYYEPYLNWRLTKGPVYSTVPDGNHGFIKTENLG